MPKLLVSYISFFYALVTCETSAQSYFVKQHNFIGFQDVNSIVQADNDDFVLLGESQQTADGTLYAFIVRTDDEGNILWKKYLDQLSLNLGFQIRKVPGGFALLTVGDFIGTRVVTINDDGNVLFPGVQTDSIYTGASFDIDNDDGFVVVAENPAKG